MEDFAVENKKMQPIKISCFPLQPHFYVFSMYFYENICISMLRHVMHSCK